MRVGPNDEFALLRLVNLRYAVEVLDTLPGRPRTYRELRRILRARRRPLTDALRALAASGALRRSGRQGTWDDWDPTIGCYELTDTGFGILRLLERIDVWDAIYGRYLADHPEVGDDGPRA